MSPFNHQVGICGADVTAPDEMHHSAAAGAAMCILLSLLRIKATLRRPGGPREERELTSLKGMASLQGRAVWLVSPGDLPYLVAREGPFLAASPGAQAWDLTRFFYPSVLGWQWTGPWGP